MALKPEDRDYQRESKKRSTRHQTPLALNDEEQKLLLSLRALLRASTVKATIMAAIRVAHAVAQDTTLTRLRPILFSDLGPMQKGRPRKTKVAVVRQVRAKTDDDE